MTAPAITATFARKDLTAAWTVRFATYGTGRETGFIPYWVTHDLAHALGTDFAVLDQRSHLEIHSPRFRQTPPDPCAEQIRRALRLVAQDGPVDLELPALLG